MKSLKSFVQNEVQKALDDLDFHIVIIADLNYHDLFQRLDEGKWKHSGEKDYFYRKDAAKFDWQQLHAHIARKKHINSKSKQVSWNADGSRHDDHTFNKNFNGIEVAKSIARRVLSIPDHIKLESFDQLQQGKMILESVANHPAPEKTFIFVVQDSTEKQILKD